MSPGYSPFQPSPPPVRPSSQGLDGNTRLLIVGGAVALVVYFAWPYVRGEMGEIGRQLSGNHAGVPPMFDPFGLMPRGEGEYAARPDRRQRQGETYGYQDPGPYRGQAPARGQGGRWRDCRGSIWSDRLDCGEWHEGRPPRESRR
jgi:hypothetical protein